MKRCPRAPKKCALCNSTTHDQSECNRAKSSSGRRTRRGKSKEQKQKWVATQTSIESDADHPVHQQILPLVPAPEKENKNQKQFLKGESSGAAQTNKKQSRPAPNVGASEDSTGVEPDSSDVDSSDSDVEEGQILEQEKDFETVHKKLFSGIKGNKGARGRGRGPNSF